VGEGANLNRASFVAVTPVKFELNRFSKILERDRARKSGTGLPMMLVMVGMSDGTEISGLFTTQVTSTLDHHLDRRLRMTCCTFTYLLP
jgi:hypothetical protein